MAVGGGLVALFGYVAHLELQGIHAQMVGQMGQMGLKAEQGLGRAEAAEGAGGECVGADALTLEVGIGDGVHAVGMEHAPLQHHIGGRQIRAAVVVNVSLGADDLAVFHSGLVDALGGVALHTELGVLFPFKHHLDGLADLILRHQQSAAQHIGEMLLSAECAAGGALADDNVIIGNVQKSCNGLADIERALRRCIEHELAVLHGGNGAVGLQMYMLLIGGGQRLLKDLVRLGEDLLHGSALLAEQLAHDIAVLFGEHGTAHTVDAVIDTHRRGLLGVIDLDLVPQVLQRSPVGANHQADGLAHIQHIVLREAAPILQNHPQFVLSLGGNVLGGNEIVSLRELGQVDSVNGSSGHRGANHIGVLHIRQRHVAYIGRLAPGFLNGVHPNNFVADFCCWHCIASFMQVL